MSRAAKDATAFLQKSHSKDEFQESFHVRSPVAKRETVGVPVSVELTPEETRRVELLLTDFATPGDDREIEEDLATLKEITAEVKSIGIHGILLQGERIARAQDLLCRSAVDKSTGKPLPRYREGAFVEWLKNTFGTTSTPYEMLQYYKFHQTLPAELKPKLEKLPKKAAYALSARKGPKEKKIDFVERYSGEPQAETLLLIRELLPLENEDRRSRPVEKNAKLLRSIIRSAKQLDIATFTATNRDQLRGVIDLLLDLETGE